MDVAHAVARYLKRAGVERVHGVPGEDHMRLLDAVEAEGLRYVAAREESAACIMATAEGQARGTPGVALVTLAPGLANAINGIANAWLDKLPLVVVCGQHAPERYPVIVRQGLDNHRLVQGITKWTVTASRRIHQVLAKALDTAMSAPRGPVFLELREDVAALSPKDNAADWPLLAGAEQCGDAGPRAASAAVEELRRALAAAKRPAIVVGGGRCSAADREAIQRLSEAIRCPVFTTPSAKGLIDPGHEWMAGAFLNGNLEGQVLGRSDLLVAVSLDARDVFNRAWPYRMPITAIEEQHNTQRFFPITREVVGSLAAVVEDVLGGPTRFSGRSAWTAGDVADYRASVLCPFFQDTSNRLTVPSALAEARDAVPDDALVAVDAGFGKPLASYLWSTGEPNSYFSSHGLSTMGYAIPAANALKLVHPQRTVVAFMGDGSLLMRASEIGVAADLGIAPIYVVWVDTSLTQIEIKQRRLDLRTVGVSFSVPSCAKLAEAFGGQGFDVESRQEFRRVLDEALKSRLPTLIGARVDQSDRERWFDLMRG